MAKKPLNDTQRKALAVAALSEMFGRPLSDPAVKMYVAALDGIAPDAVERAALQACQSCERMPPPVELRELAGEVRYEDRAALAWEVVIRTIPEVSGYGSPNFDDPIINAAIRAIGGWVPLCDQTIEQQDRFTRSAFLKAYGAFCRTGVSDDQAAPLVGLHENSNRVHGYAVTTRNDIATGLPWAGANVKRIGGNGTAADVPRLELKKPCHASR